MSLLTMQKLQVITLKSQKHDLLKALIQLGCVEILETTEPDSFSKDSSRSVAEAVTGEQTRTKYSAIQTALSTLDHYSAAKKSALFSVPEMISFQALSQNERLEKALTIAGKINQLKAHLDTLRTEEEKYTAQKHALMPWVTLDLPMEAPSTAHVELVYGVIPTDHDPLEFENELLLKIPEACIQWIHSNREQHHIVLLYHRSRNREMQSLLKQVGFIQTNFKPLTGTVLDAIEEKDRQLNRSLLARAAFEQDLIALLDLRHDLEFAHDILYVLLQLDNAGDILVGSEKTSYLEGWVPKDRTKEVTELLNTMCCAYNLSDPDPEDAPPVAFSQPKLFSPFAIIANLYGTPRYGSIIDPTPYMAPFFFIFFGMMVTDAAYGILLSLLALWVLMKMKQDGFVRQIFQLVLYCGISTFIFGVIFGSWFGDFIPAFTKMWTGEAISLPPLWFNPLEKPMTMLYFAFALGGLQIIIGLGLSGWRQIQTGHLWDAIFDVGLWYLVLFGLTMALLNIPFGLQMAAIGAIGIIFTAGRNEKNIFKRLLTGILALYGVTGYLADVLSYSRLLALGLASGVIASVINAMGTIGGKSALGLIALILIFIVGHAFNLAINLVGAYVHASRLQYVEFFSKFYDGGGKPFTPYAPVTTFIRFEPNKR